MDMDDNAERMRLLTHFANSYSAYFKSEELTQELSKLQEYVEESVVKLEELQSLFEMNKAEYREWVETIVPCILQQNKATLEVFGTRLEYLSRIVQSLKTALDTLETQIIQAEHAFGLNSPFRNVLSYFRRPVEPAAMVHTLENAKFIPIDINIESMFVST
ncbi:unnamed protein product [Allacma fusca]|uniref:Uncharacterized protein n=1 Tax=Allacma fusca TaxID=39272 RepID=A0A8J2LJ60_9HEXA|nr:unnamed protein product [Allacma fusca]